MSGFAFAAIYKEPIPPDGPGPDGPDIPPVDSDDPSYYTYTISGESITPFVPFTVTVTGSNSKAKGNHGNLQADIDYEIRDGGAWEGGKCEWTLGTRVCDSRRTNAKFSWLISGREPVTATLAYDAGTMEPEIEDSSVVLGQTFDFSITFSGAGDDCYATRFADFGASYWWEAQKAGKWERTNRISVNQTPSFSNGVLSGKGYVGNLVGYDKIRLCVSYAGLATAYAEAAITSTAVTITLGDDSLHVWGPSTTLKIESESLQYMTAEFKRNGNATQDITDTNGDPIAFTFSGDTWTGDIQAATSAAEGTVKLVVKYGNEVVKEQEIGIATEFLPTISATPQSIIQGDSFDMTGSIASMLGLLSRVPANCFKLVAVQNGTTLAEVNNLAGSQEVEYEGVTPSTLDTVYVRIIDNYDETIVAEVEVAVKSVYEALAEAINERNLAKGYTTSYTGQEQPSQLASYARNAMYNYVKESATDFSTNTIVYYNSNNGGNTEIYTSLPSGMTEVQWMADCYTKICKATKIVRTSDNSFSYLTCTSWRKDVSVFERQTNEYIDGQYIYEDISNTVSRAKNKVLTTWTTTDFMSSSEVDNSILGYAYVDVGEEGHYVHAQLQQRKIQIQLTSLPPIACTVNIYSGIAKYNNDTTFNKMGANIADDGKYGIIGTYEQGTETLVMSPIVIDANVNFRNNTGTSDSAYGFKGGNFPVVLDYHFNHK
mgnify:CR=1 FL=1